jgi:sporulation protein YlmC with PRC-barrel domain
MKKFAITALAFTALAGPVVAAEFYVVQDVSTKNCTIVETKPSSATMTILDNGKIYMSRAEAEAAMKAATLCAAASRAEAAPMAPASTAPASMAAPTSATHVTAIRAAPAGMALKHFYNQNVYDQGGSKIGEIDDIIIGSNGSVAAFVIGAGGFIGIGEKHVLVPFNAVHSTMKDGKAWLTMNATKDELKSAPAFKYDNAKTEWIVTS